MRVSGLFQNRCLRILLSGAKSKGHVYNWWEDALEVDLLQASCKQTTLTPSLPAASNISSILSWIAWYYKLLLFRSQQEESKTCSPTGSVVFFTIAFWMSPIFTIRGFLSCSWSFSQNFTFDLVRIRVSTCTRLESKLEWATSGTNQI